MILIVYLFPFVYRLKSYRIRKRGWGQRQQHHRPANWVTCQVNIQNHISQTFFGGRSFSLNHLYEQYMVGCVRVHCFESMVRLKLFVNHYTLANPTTSITIILQQIMRVHSTPTNICQKFNPMQNTLYARLYGTSWGDARDETVEV